MSEVRADVRALFCDDLGAIGHVIMLVLFLIRVEPRSLCRKAMSKRLAVGSCRFRDPSNRSEDSEQ